MITHFAIAQGNKCQTFESVSPRLSNDSALIEGVVCSNTEDKPPVQAKAYIKEIKKEIYTDGMGHFKAMVLKGKCTVAVMTVDKTSGKEKDTFAMQVKVDAKPQHHIKLTFLLEAKKK